ncbi:MAG: trigger factor [Candidatus Omnitrophota bacterium]
MKNKITHIEECRKSFEIEVPSADVKKKLQESIAKIAKVAAVPGFRAGKAPVDLVERHYGERATQDVIEEIIAESYHKGLEEAGFLPLGLPEISDVKLDESKTLTFKAHFNTRPVTGLKEYKGLALTRKKVEVTDDELERSITSLRESHAKFVTAAERAVRIGDYIVCDSQVSVDGKPIAKKRENVWMPVEDKSYIPGLSAALAGMKVGEEKAVDALLPEDFGAKEYAGKKALFHIKVNEIKEKAVPELNEEFSKEMGYATPDELRVSVRKLLDDQHEHHARQDMENQALDALLQELKFSVPQSFIERQAHYLVEREKEKLAGKGIKAEELKVKEKEMTEKFMPVAERQVRTMFILDEIGDREKIEASVGEVDAALEELARQYGQPLEKVREHYEKNDLISSLKTDIKHSKILEFLVAQAKVEEVAQPAVSRP